jgi:uncharacterized membrane protein HdeD (DUF308 family)
MSSGSISAEGRNWWVPVILGAISIAFGAYLLVRPVEAIVALVWAIGVVSVAEGLASLFALFDKRVTLPKAWLVLYGVASIVFGYLAISRPAAIIGFLLVFVAVWLVVAGVFRIIFAIRVRKAIEGEFLIALSGMLAIALGLLFLYSPASALVAAKFWIGVGSLLYGGLQVGAGLMLRRHRTLAA